AGVVSLADEVADCGDVRRPRAPTALAPDDDPMDVRQPAREVDAPEQGLGGDEPHGARVAPREQWEPLVRTLLVLDGDALPQVRERVAETVHVSRALRQQDVVVAHL